MIPIYTKLVLKKWFCFGTFDGTDYSYTGRTKMQAQEKMKKRLEKSELTEHANWMKEESIQPPMEMKTDNWVPPKIDNNPIA